MSQFIDREGNAVIPENVTGIGDMAFAGCHDLKTVTIHAGVSYILGRAFFDCPNLEAFSVAPDNKTFVSIDGVLFTRSGGLLRCPPAKSGSYAIPAGVTGVGDHAFLECDRLTAVRFPDSLRRIGVYAFDYCTGLTEVTFPAGLETTGRRAFGHCTNLTRAVVRGKATEVVNTTFMDCPNVTLYVPEGSLAQRMAAEDRFGDYPPCQVTPPRLFGPRT